MEMTIKRALDLFNITSVSDKVLLKKIYRQQMKKNHPDAGGCEVKSAEINKAFDLLNKAFDEGYFKSNMERVNQERYESSLEGYVFTEKPIVRLSFEDLDRILDKESIKMVVDSIPVEMTKGLLSKCKVILQDSVRIVSETGGTSDYKVSTSYSVGSRELRCNIILNDESSLNAGVVIYVGNKSIKVKQLRAGLTLNYKFNNYLLEITIMR